MSPSTLSPPPPPPLPLLTQRSLTPTYESLHNQYQHLLSHERAGVALERSLWLSERALYKSKLAAAEATIASLRQELEGLRSNNHNGPPRNGRHSPTASASPPPAPLVEDGEVKVEGEEEAKEFHEIDEKTANRLYEQARRVVYPRAQRSWPEEKIDGDEGGGAGGGTNGHSHGHGHGDDGDGDGDDEEGDIKLILKKNTNFGWAF